MKQSPRRPIRLATPGVRMRLVVALTLAACSAACGPDDGPKRNGHGPDGAVSCLKQGPAPPSALVLEAARRAEAWANAGADPGAWPEYPAGPFELALPDCLPNVELDSRGGVIAHDLDGDGLLDYLVSGREPDARGGRTGLAALDWAGRLLFAKDVELKLQAEGDTDDDELPNHYGPGFAVGDVDDDGEAEIVHLDRRNRVHVRSGTTGNLEYMLGPFDLPRGAERWGHLQVVNLRGLGDVDLVLQADPLPHRWLLAVRAEDGSTLWSRDDYRGPKHGGFRAFDLDGDGRDELAGATLIDDDGRRMNDWDYRDIAGHTDALHAADVLPDAPGLEVVMTEESYVDDRTALLGIDEVYWYGTRDGDEPQNIAIGEFDADRAGLEIWNRSRFELAQRPWVLDSSGQVIAEWSMNDVKPPGWTEKGVEQIYALDWTGGGPEYLAAKERHAEGRAALIDALTGAFVATFDGHARRIYAVDVSGDAREELVVLDAVDGVLRVHWNAESNPHPARPRKWAENVYRRSKQNYNYYSP